MSRSPKDISGGSGLKPWTHPFFTPLHPSPDGQETGPLTMNTAKKALTRPPEAKQDSFGYKAFYRVVARIPKGKVATYGQIAALADRPRHARQVGYALHALPYDNDLPWQRVINSKGEVSQRKVSGPENLQRAILENEGIVFSTHGRVDLKVYGWKPRTRQKRESYSKRKKKA